MRSVTAFFRLIRWQNLLFIVLTQVLFYFCIYRPLFADEAHRPQLAWLMLASVLIAAAGYIINDYFDLDIDQINKPKRNVLNKTINRRWAILLHLLMSLAGVVATALAVGLAKWHLVLANVVCVMLLWMYSTSFKRQAVIGNVVISVLTAWTILVLFFAIVPFDAAFGASELSTVRFFRISFLYGGFAFIISLVREAIKDVEDMEGDRRGGCKTLPIVAGVAATKIYTEVWIVVLIAALLVLQLYVMQFGWWWAIAYATLFVIIPLFYLFFQHRNANSTSEFARLSSLTKWIMLGGIISMVFFRIYS